MTPRLAESASGLRTQGNPTPRAARNGSSLSAMRRKRGTGRPDAARHWRISYLLRAAATAATGLVRSPSRSAIAAAAVAVWSSTPTTASSGRRRLQSAAWRAAESGSAKSSVSSESGARSSSVLGRSDAQTRSTPRPGAAATKASVRYVRVGRRRRSRARGLRFPGRVVRVVPGRVVGGVEHLGDLGNLFLDEALDPGLERDVGRAAALAATAHDEVDAVVLHVDQLDDAAVARHRRVDHGVDEFLNPGLEVGALVRAFSGHGITSLSPMVPEDQGPTRSIKATWPWIGSLQQNHASLNRGARRRSVGGTGDCGRGFRPAASSASALTRAHVMVASSRASAAAATSVETRSCNRSIRASGWAQR